MKINPTPGYKEIFNKFQRLEILQAPLSDHGAKIKILIKVYTWTINHLDIRRKKKNNFCLELNKKQIEPTITDYLENNQ